MDKNNIIGLVLIFILFGVSFYFMKPSDLEIQREQALQDSLKRVREGIVDPVASNGNADSASNTLVLDSAALAKPFGAATVGDENLITLENELLKVELTAKGGKVKTVELKGEKNHDGGPLYLVEGENNKFGFLFNAAGENINTDNLYFTSVNSSATSATLRLNYNENHYSLAPDSYNLALNIQAVGIQNLIDIKQNSILFNWETTLLRKEPNVKSEREKSTVFYKNTERDVDHLSETSDDSEKIVKEKIEWIAFKQHFFSTILSSKQPFENADLAVSFVDNDQIVKNYKSTAELAFNTQGNNAYDFNFFFGPNQYKSLKAEDKDYQQIINMGWGPIRWINQYITVPLFDFLDGFHMSYGIVILILTLLLKGAMFPLTRKSYLSMAKMR